MRARRRHGQRSQEHTRAAARGAARRPLAGDRPGTRPAGGKFLRTCLIGVRLGKLLGVSEEDLAAVYYLGLTQHLGCTAYASEAAAIFGDEIEANAWLLSADHGNPGEMIGAVLRQQVRAGLLDDEAA